METTTAREWGLLPATSDYAWPHVALDVDLLLLLAERTEREGNQYRLGGKAPTLDADSSVISRIGIDCSGYLRWLLYRATHGELVIPDGSWMQAEWADDAGLKRSSIDAGEIIDGAVRMAQMPPASGGGIGHIALIHNGRTIESSGRRGPGRREWTGTAWQSRCRVWVISPPTK